MCSKLRTRSFNQAAPKFAVDSSSTATRVAVLRGFVRNAYIQHALQSKFAPVACSIEKRRNECLLVKRHQVFHRFACSDILHGQAEFARDGHDDAALGRAVELGQYYAGNARSGGEFTRLRKSILSG